MLNALNYANYALRSDSAIMPKSNASIIGPPQERAQLLTQTMYQVIDRTQEFLDLVDLRRAGGRRAVPRPIWSEARLH